MDPKKPLSIQECINKRKEILALSSKDKVKKSTLDKIAVWITNHVGSMGFYSFFMDSDLAHLEYVCTKSCPL